MLYATLENEEKLKNLATNRQGKNSISSMVNNFYQGGQSSTN